MNHAQSLLQNRSAQIPATLTDVEKQKFIGLKLLAGLTEDQKSALQELFNSFLIDMRQREASDIDIGGWGSQDKIWMRIHGAKKPIDALGQYTRSACDILIQNLLTENQRNVLYENRNLDFSHSFTGPSDTIYRYRADTYFETGALALNMRAINTEIFNYASYGFHPEVTKTVSLTHTKEGLVLVTGITGSGKSSTLDAFVDLNNRTADGHIVIIASPVEFVHESKRCIIRHREVGRDTLSFKNGTVEALRQDPDIIVIGEMRDPATILAALEAADSGHKVLSTLHTSSASESIHRIVAEAPAEEQNRIRNRLADTLRCVISQKLIPSTSGKRILAKEIMVTTPSIRAAILNENIGEIYQMISQSSKIGMITIEQDLARLLRERKITMDTAMSFANNKRRLKQILELM